MDEFAQSRGDDDLFADEFESVAEPSIVVEAEQEVAEPQHSSAEAAGESSTQGAREFATANQAQRNGRHDRGQGQGQGGRRGRGGATSKPTTGLGASRYATTPSEPIPTPPSDTTQPQPTSTTTTTALENAQDTATQSTKPIPATEPIINARTPAVRGDRSATGGPAHKKLTEEELTAKMERMAIVNAQKAERHRLSEADQAAFQHREKELAKERKEKAVAEKRNERAMEMERAKNRERKMKAQGGREWDSEKVESDIVDGRGRGRSSEYVRGGHGGVIRGGLGASKYSIADDSETPVPEYAARGRGGGRGGRGRGGARGGRAPSTAVPTAEDFPSLPKPIKAATEKVTSPIGDKPAGDWAEEMATPVEEKKSAL